MRLYLVECSLLRSAVTVSIFGFAIGFGRFFDKNRGSGSVSVFIGSDFNHVQSRERYYVHHSRFGS